MRIACGIEYDGGGFLGWQRQRPQVRTVQAEVERALGRVADSPVTITCAGRTDAGVHASMQVCHFDTAAMRMERAWVMGANTHLPEDVALYWARAVSDDFHARFSACARRYRYVILEGWNRPALWRGRAAWSHARLDTAAMAAAGQHLIGEHDFSAFRSAECQSRHARREVMAVNVQRRDQAVVVEVEANAFLHNMVRIIAGALMVVGRGEQPAEWLRELLAGRDRRRGGPTAPPAGLYFVGPRYPLAFGLPDPRPPPWPADEGPGEPGSVVE